MPPSMPLLKMAMDKASFMPTPHSGLPDLGAVDFDNLDLPELPSLT